MTVSRIARNRSSGTPGSIIAVAHSNSVPGYVKANGAVVSRSAYADLFSAVGTTYGAGDGSTTFSIPDLRGTFVRGLDESRGYDASRALGTYQADSLKPHTHSNLGNNQNRQVHSGGTFPSSLVNSTSSTFGGTETRPANVALTYHIRY